jgi:hypothetical protein
MDDARTKGGSQRRFLEKAEAEDGGNRSLSSAKTKDYPPSMTKNSAFGWSIQDAIASPSHTYASKRRASPSKSLWRARRIHVRGVGEIRLAGIENRLARFAKVCGEKT